jgi:hypothetical protein
MPKHTPPTGCSLIALTSSGGSILAFPPNTLSIFLLSMGGVTTGHEQDMLPYRL